MKYPTGDYDLFIGLIIRTEYGYMVQEDWTIGFSFPFFRPLMPSVPGFEAKLNCSFVGIGFLVLL